MAVLAHRGGTGPWRENTLEAFVGALARGADGVEFDVRRSRDGRLVVHHDADIPGVGAIHALDRGDLPPWVPTLEEALGACAGAAVNVEVKNSPVDPGYDPKETVADEVVATLERMSGASKGPARVVVSSFWPPTVAAVRAVGPGWPTGLLVHPSRDAVDAARQAMELGCAALHPFHHQATNDLVGQVHEMGMAVVVWTVNEPDDLRAVAAAGADAVISDRVETARAVLGGP